MYFFWGILLILKHYKSLSSLRGCLKHLFYIGLLLLNSLFETKYDIFSTPWCFCPSALLFANSDLLPPPTFLLPIHSGGQLGGKCWSWQCVLTSQALPSPSWAACVYSSHENLSAAIVSPSPLYTSNPGSWICVCVSHTVVWVMLAYCGTQLKQDIYSSLTLLCLIKWIGPSLGF